MSWKGDTYDEIVSNFKWDIPEYFNIGVDICDKWADDKYRLALIFLDQDGKEQKITYWELKNLSNRFANSLSHRGIGKGDRLAILMPPSLETLENRGQYRLDFPQQCDQKERTSK